MPATETRIVHARHGATLIRNIETHVTLSPDDIARAFCEMDATQQAAFFVAVDSTMKTWDGHAPAAMQRHHIGTAMRGTIAEEARWMLADILETAEEPQREQPDPDGEAFRGTQAVDYEREQMEAARRLK